VPSLRQRLIPTPELVRAIAASLASFEEASGAREGIRTLLSGAKNPAEVKARAITGLQQLSRLLDRKAPGDAKSFKEWLRNVSQDVAEASNEGGFLGIGGIRVSEAEKAHYCRHLSCSQSLRLTVLAYARRRHPEAQLRSISMCCGI
jgi:hypothetical protein